MTIFGMYITLLMIKGLLVYPLLVAGFSADPPPPCPVKPPCTCDFNKIQCSGLNLTEVPSFTKVNVTWSGWTIDLTHNQITRIPARAFVNVTPWSLQISHNSIDTLEDTALLGSESKLDSVFMQFNNFKELPREIARMPKLTMLSIHDNPITTLPQDMSFASSLQFLDIGSPEMSTWPSAIRTLKAVWSLTLYKLSMKNLPIDAFEGLENSIQSLTFTSTNFVVIPKAIRRLQKMTSLAITDNLALTSDGIPSDAFLGLHSLSEIYIRNSSITNVPNISYIPALTHLTISDSPVSSWEVNTLPMQPILQSVTLSNTNLPDIPEALHYVTSLTMLTLDGTKINSIGSFDLNGLQKLQYLDLSQSEVSRISDTAFDETHSLLGLRLDNTKISGFPRAIKSLPALRSLGLFNDTIECTCSEMGWMKTWIGIKQLLDCAGECSNIKGMQLGDFIRNEIPKCP